MSIHSQVARQSSITKLVRDVKMLKTHFYNRVAKRGEHSLTSGQAKFNYQTRLRC